MSDVNKIENSKTIDIFLKENGITDHKLNTETKGIKDVHISFLQSKLTANISGLDILRINFGNPISIILSDYESEDVNVYFENTENLKGYLSEVINLSHYIENFNKKIEQFCLVEP